jgi:hypothetical protein
MNIKTQTILALAVFIASIGAISSEQALRPQTASGPDEAGISAGKRTIRKPQLTKQQERQLKEAVDRAQQVACSPGIFPAPIAVSVYGHDHVTGGQDVLLTYKNVITNEGGAWSTNSASNFVPQCAGLYFFTVSFVKDAYYYGGTMDDVMVYLTKNQNYIGEAWSGEGGGSRGTGVYSVTLRLVPGDAVQTFVHSDGGPTRHLSDYNFTGYRIAP